MSETRKVLQPPRNGRFRALIVTEVWVLTFLLVLLVSIMVYVNYRGTIGISWFSVGIAAAAVMGEIVRRYRHLRSDLRHDYGSKE